MDENAIFLFQAHIKQGDCACPSSGLAFQSGGWKGVRHGSVSLCE